jgi:hypothetical protein
MHLTNTKCTLSTHLTTSSRWLLRYCFLTKKKLLVTTVTFIQYYFAYISFILTNYYWLSPFIIATQMKEANATMPDDQNEHCATIEMESPDYTSRVGKKSKQKITARDVSLFTGILDFVSPHSISDSAALEHPEKPPSST